MPKVLFICGSLEPDKDGVGDYVWKLATSLLASGFSCTCVSLSDEFVTPKTSITELTDFPNVISRYRISASSSWREKLKLLNTIAIKEKPSFISFHYGPYTYSSRGVPIRLVNCLPKLNYKCNWQLMLHELWVDPSLKISNKLLSPFQRFLLKIFVDRISPSIVNTTNTYYVRQLLRIGVKSEKLPIFSNINHIKVPIIPRDTSSWNFLFFGSIHPEWEYEYLFNAINLARIKSNIVNCRFTLIGHAGDYGVNLWSHLAINYKKNNFIFKNLGALPAKEISYQLQLADFGVTTTPSHLIEKSGSVAAMVAHSLPVIIPRVTNHFLDFNMALEENSSFILFKKGYELQLKISTRHEPVDQLQSSTNQFIESLLSVR